MGQQASDILSLSIVSAPGAVTQYRGVDFTGAQIAAAGARGMGIAKRSAALGQSFDVAVIGTAICEAGAAITVGAPLAFDNQGRVVPASALAIAAGAVAMTSAAANGAADLVGSITPEYRAGEALEAATGAGVFIEVLLAR